MMINLTRVKTRNVNSNFMGLFSQILILFFFCLQVEYKDQSSGQTQLALAEAPNEALPLDCRPNFGAAWLTKDKFKVSCKAF